MAGIRPGRAAIGGAPLLNFAAILVGLHRGGSAPDADIALGEHEQRPVVVHVIALSYVGERPTVVGPAQDLPPRAKGLDLSVAEENVRAALRVHLDVVEPDAVLAAVVELLRLVLVDGQVIGRAITAPPGVPAVVRIGVVNIIAPRPEVLLLDFLGRAATQP